MPLVIALLIGAGVGVKYGRHHVFAKRFAEVEPGQVYRSGRLERGPYERVVREHHIRTILTLLRDEPESRHEAIEREIAGRVGLRVVRIPMPGDGRGEFDALEQAASVIADPAQRPVLVHCAAGVHRTGASLAVWRIRYQGWTLEQALAEMVKHGYDRDADPELAEHLHRWYAERMSSTTAPAPPTPGEAPITTRGAAEHHSSSNVN